MSLIFRPVETLERLIRAATDVTSTPVTTAGIYRITGRGLTVGETLTAVLNHDGTPSLQLDFEVSINAEYMRLEVGDTIRLVEAGTLDIQRVVTYVPEMFTTAS